MNLTVDVGNTKTKIAVFDQHHLLKTDSFKTLDVDQLKALLEKYEIKSSILSETGAPLSRQAIEFLDKQTRYYYLNDQLKLPFVNNYKTPQTLGKDRIAAVAGSRSISAKTNTLIIDAGTCITFDFIDEHNHYYGGGITPGISMRLKALNNFTDKLPLVKREKFETLIGQSTKESILSGVQNGIIAEVNGMIDRYKNEYKDLKILLTGGDAIFFESKLKNEIFAIPNLIPIGLNEILNLNAI